MKRKPEALISPLSALTPLSSHASPSHAISSHGNRETLSSRLSRDLPARKHETAAGVSPSAAPSLKIVKSSSLSSHAALLSRKHETAADLPPPVAPSLEKLLSIFAELGTSIASLMRFWKEIIKEASLYP
ncbi:uncharacterized protein LOC110021929 [Phalaenopsis equestris]|uniref:uncharacterized protein LOC110021929 n=1 Tax=Phalaenopsis equestris TaxID=78828 RepID=UPI0009E3AA0C|nr:uncharacterized protein LOC110021929 [Phalaenopsis equestris]